MSQVSGVGREVFSLGALAITIVATALFEECAIVFGASFSRRKQKRAKMRFEAGRIPLKGIFTYLSMQAEAGRIFFFYCVEAS
jgi:hypothetical protein